MNDYNVIAYNVSGIYILTKRPNRVSGNGRPRTRCI